MDAAPGGVESVDDLPKSAREERTEANKVVGGIEEDVR